MIQWQLTNKQTKKERENLFLFDELFRYRLSLFFRVYHRPTSRSISLHTAVLQAAAAVDQR